jgi:hypothetical protein
MFTYHAVILLATTSSAIHCSVPHITAIMTEAMRILIVLQCTYLKYFTHQSTMMPRKTPTEELKRKPTVLILY